MTLIIPTIEDTKDLRFCCIDTYAVFSLHGVCQVYEVKGPNLTFLYSIPFLQFDTPTIRLNPSCFNSSLLMAALSYDLLTIVNINERQIIHASNTALHVLVWDPLQPSSFYASTPYGQIGHYIISSKTELINDWSEHFGVLINRIVIPSTDPNCLFFLTDTGTVFYYKRKSAAHSPTFIRSFSMNERITELAGTPYPSVIVGGSRFISMFDLSTYKISTLYSQSSDYSEIIRIIAHPSHPDTLFVLLKNHRMHALSFDDRGQLHCSHHCFEFIGVDEDYIRSIFVMNEYFAFFTKDFRLFSVSYSPSTESFYVVSITAPVRTDLSVQPYATSDRLLLYTTEKRIAVVDRRFQPLLVFSPSRHPTEFILDSSGNVVYASGSALSVFSPSRRDHLIASSDSFNGDHFRQLQVAGEFVSARVGENRILVFSSTQNSASELFYFPEIDDYRLILSTGSDKPTFLIAIGAGSKTSIVNKSRAVVAQYDIRISGVSVIYEYGGELWLLRKNGTLSNLRGKTHTLAPSIAGCFRCSEIVIQRNKSIFEVYHAATLRLISSMTLEGRLLCYADGQFLIGSENIYWCPIQPIQEFAVETKTPFQELKLRECDTLAFLSKWVAFESKVLALAQPPPIPEDATWFAYFAGVQVVPLKRLDATPVFSAAFMAMRGMEVSEEQREFFVRCAEKWEGAGRCMSAAIVREFLGEKEKCCQDLRRLKKFDLALFYAKKNGMEEIGKEIMMEISREKIGGGDVVVGAVYMAKAGKIQEAVDMLVQQGLPKAAHDLIDFVN